jgi:hypothetical protein
MASAAVEHGLDKRRSKLTFVGWSHASYTIASPRR